MCYMFMKSDENILACSDKRHYFYVPLFWATSYSNSAKKEKKSRLELGEVVSGARDLSKSAK